MHSTLATLVLLSTPIHATITAKIWAHFYPNCPGDPYSTLDTYESYEETVPTKVITAGMCTSFGVPSFNHELVSSISVDAELVPSNQQSIYPADTGTNCNITVHEEPECIDPALINQALHRGVEVSPCASRSFAAFSQVWIQLNCEESPHHDNVDADTSFVTSVKISSSSKSQNSMKDEGGEEARLENSADTADLEIPSTMQNPGSNFDKWASAQSEHASERRPQEIERVNREGHAESDRIVHDLMEKLKNQTASMVSGKHNATRPLNGSLSLDNGSAMKNRTMIRRKLSVLRNRAARVW